MSLIVKRTGAEEYGNTAKLLIAGAPGAGKTRIGSTFPYPFYANVEGGLMSVADRAVPYTDITSSDDLMALLQALRQPPKARESILGAPVRTVIIDTLDAFQKMLIDERKRAEKKDTMAVQDWGWLGDQLRLVVRNYRNLDLNVIFTVHLKTTEDGETGQTFVMPGLQGAMGDEIAAYVDIAGLLKASPVNRVKDGKTVRVLQRLLQTSPDSRHPWLKDRSGKLPMELEVNLVNDGTGLLKMIYGVAPLQPTEQIAAPEESQVVTPAAAAVAPAAAPPPAAGAPPLPARGLAEPPKRGPKPKPAEVPSPIAEQAPPIPDKTPEVVPENPERALPTPDVELSAPQANGTAPVLAVVPDDPTDPAKSMICSECGEVIDSEDFRDLSLVRFRAPLCRNDYQAKKAARK